MNLLEAIEKKNAMKNILEDSISYICDYTDIEKLSYNLTEIDKLVDDIFLFERKINYLYQDVMITLNDSIYDTLVHIDALDKKIEILNTLLIEDNKREIKSGVESKLNRKAVLSSIGRYKTLKNNLEQKVREVCYNTEFITNIQG